ncbi:lipopolysaccharide biosynthesis protein [Nocardioides jejuensis]|uniref:Lipopolysaccharide biosynthesis protein n=1 Tax=Nocardioides jejuensis TaxID=2502782 RepID=A0A4R1CGD8_9ACTN|nr:hypothetical protein [Nocardioides jejuensis]TCJ30209.1 hypothetical protein EPD65_04815 [Nocardioides jejuensis]
MASAPGGMRKAAPRPGSLRRNLLANLVGIAAYNLGQWLLLVVLARMTGTGDVGRFALALAISAPVYLAVGLNLRMVRATDARREWRPEQYGRLRIVLNAVSLAVVMAIGLGLHMSTADLMLLGVVSISKAVEATSQVLYGFFTLRERLDLVSRSLVLRAVLGLASFSGALVAGLGVTAAAAGLAGAWFVVYLFHDRPEYQRALATDADYMAAQGLVAGESSATSRLARRALPLGVDAGVGSVALNVPRYGVQLSLGVDHLAVFASLAYLAQVVSFITGAFGDAVLGRLVVLHHTSSAKAFWRVLFAVLFFGCAVTGAAVVGAALVGRPVIGALMGHAYVDQSVLLILLTGAGMVTLQRSLARALYARQRFVDAMLVDTAVLIASLGWAALLIPRWGLDGAAAVLGLSFLVGTFVTLALLGRSTRVQQGE